MTDQIQQLADKAAPDIRRAFLAAIDLARQNIDIDELTAAIIAGDLETIHAAIGLTDDDLTSLRVAFVSGENSFTETLSDAFSGAALIAASVLATGFTPKTEQAARNHANDIINGAVSESATAARQSVTRVLESPEHPHTKAARVRASIGLTERQAANMDRLREALIEPIFRARIIIGDTVRELPIMRNLSASQRASVRKAISEGLTPESAEAILEKHRRALINHRARTIAATEAQRAANAGELEAWRQGQAKGIVAKNARRFWKTAGDERVRALHNQIPPMNAKGAGLKEPFTTPFGPLLHPPAEINCRCRVILKDAA